MSHPKQGESSSNEVARGKKTDKQQPKPKSSSSNRKLQSSSSSSTKNEQRLKRMGSPAKLRSFSTRSAAAKGQPSESGAKVDLGTRSTTEDQQRLGKAKERINSVFSEQQKKETHSRRDHSVSKRKRQQNTGSTNVPRRVIEERRQSVHDWYKRLGKPDRASLKSMIESIQGCDIVPDDVDLLPWDTLMPYEKKGNEQAHSVARIHQPTSLKKLNRTQSLKLRESTWKTDKKKPTQEFASTRQENTTQHSSKSNRNGSKKDPFEDRNTNHRFSSSKRDWRRDSFDLPFDDPFENEILGHGSLNGLSMTSTSKGLWKKDPFEVGLSTMSAHCPRTRRLSKKNPFEDESKTRDTRKVCKKDPFEDYYKKTKNKEVDSFSLENDKFNSNRSPGEVITEKRRTRSRVGRIKTASVVRRDSNTSRTSIVSTSTDKSSNRYRGTSSSDAEVFSRSSLVTAKLFKKTSRRESFGKGSRQGYVALDTEQRSDQRPKKHKQRRQSLSSSSHSSTCGESVSMRSEEPCFFIP